MENVLLSLIILFVGGLFGFIVLIWREMVNEKRFTNISNELDKFKILLSKDLSSLKEEIEPMKEFILTAQTDLGTIVKEYEINGIPLGYDRGKKADYIEGL